MSLYFASMLVRQVVRNVQGGSLRLAVLSLFPDVTCEPKSSEEEESDARTDGACIVGPCGTQEARILVMPRRNDRHGCGCLKKRESDKSVSDICKIGMNMHVPFSSPVDDKFEYAVPVGCAELDLVLPWLPGNWRKRNTDVRVEHSELELHVRDVRIGLPARGFRVICRYIGCIHLQTTPRTQKLTLRRKETKTYNFIVDSIHLRRSQLVDTMVGSIIYPEGERLLECPCCNFLCKQLVPRSFTVG